jgi:DNA-binding NarL/FixJ family response regulator
MNRGCLFLGRSRDLPQWTMCKVRRAWIIDVTVKASGDPMNASFGQKPNQHSLARTLTEREVSVLALIADGKRNREISEALAITERTVKFHVSGLFAKLGASNRTEAVRLAVQRGLVQL